MKSSALVLSFLFVLLLACNSKPTVKEVSNQEIKKVVPKVPMFVNPHGTIRVPALQPITPGSIVPLASLGAYRLNEENLLGGFIAATPTVGEAAFGPWDFRINQLKTLNTQFSIPLTNYQEVYLGTNPPAKAPDGSTFLWYGHSLGIDSTDTNLVYTKEAVDALIKKSLDSLVKTYNLVPKK